MSATTTLGMLFAFAAVLRALEPAELSATFSLLRLALQAIVCFGAGTAIAWACASRALADLGAADRDATGGLDCAHRTAARFAAGSFAVWMACAAVGIAVELQVSPQGAHVSDRLLAFAALGLIAAAGNTLLAARVMAPVAEALSARVPAANRVLVARLLALAWTMRLLVASLVFAPVTLIALLDQARARAGAAAVETGAGLAARGLADRARARPRRRRARERAAAPVGRLDQRRGPPRRERSGRRGRRVGRVLGGL